MVGPIISGLNSFSFFMKIGVVNGHRNKKCCNFLLVVKLNLDLKPLLLGHRFS